MTPPPSRQPAQSRCPRFSRILEGYAKLDLVFWDIGCRAGKINTYELKGKCRKIIGVDVTSAVMQNPLIDGDFVYDVNALPLPSGSVDEVFSDYVQERVVLPRVSAVEISRVLRPGGLYLSSTPD